MKKNPLPDNELLRLERLNKYGLTGLGKDPEFDIYAQCAALITGCPASLVALMEEDVQRIQSCVVLELDTVARKDTVCQYTMMSAEALVIPDTHLDERTANNNIINAGGIRFYAGVPVLDEDHFVLGTICVVDYKPRHLEPEQLTSLKLLAKAAGQLYTRKTKEAESGYYSNLFGLTQNMICVMDKSFVIKQANPAFRRTIQKNEQQLLGQPFQFLFNGNAPSLIHALTSCIENKDSALQTESLTEWGAKLNIQWHFKFEPKYEEIFAFGRDITRETAERDKLEASERRFRNFFENAIGLMSMHDLEGNIIKVNEKGREILQYEAHEVEQLHLRDLFPPENRKYCDEYLQQIGNEKEMSGMMTLLTKSGEKLYFLYHNILEIDNDGNPYIVSTALNMTERRKLYSELGRKEAMLQSFVKYVPASVSMFDAQSNFLMASQQWREEFQLKTQQLEGRNLFEIFPNIPANRKEIYANALKGIFYKNQDEIMRFNNQETPQHFNWEVRPWHIQDENIGGFIIFTQNITDSVLKNEELIAAKHQADQASRAKSEFLANMSHEIRTPLNGVIGFSDLLMRTPLNEIQLQYLKYINESGSSLLSIINDILDFSKIESGKLELFIDQCDLYELTSQVVNVVLFQAQRKNLELLLNIQQGLPRAIWVDDSRIKQVLINLMGNAVKFTEEGEIELKVEERDRTKNKIRLRFSVRDSGIGIAPDRQERIFQAFTQEDSSVSKRYGGTGLGLTISNNLLKYMDSQLELHSELGKGSVFQFDLEVEFEEIDQKEDEVWPIQKALIVDDNANNRTILQHMLQHRRIETIQVKNGMEALQLLMDGEVFDLILVDYHMPILTGVETIEKIRELSENAGQNIPLIILHTSSEEQEMMSKLRSENMAISLMKPIISDELYKAISRSVRDAHKSENPESQATDLSGMDLKQSAINAKILVADDIGVNMILNVRILSDLMPEAEVVQVTDGLQAVEECKKQSFDIILMDVQMPNMDGLEATRQIRKMQGYANTPIIGITAGNIRGEKEKCLEAGMTDFLAKPIRINDLESTLKPFLEGLRAGTVPSSASQISDFDIQVIEEHFGEDEEFKKYFLNLIVEELESAGKNLLQAYLDRETTNLNMVLHKLKGTSSSVGLKKLADEVTKLEKSSMNGMDLDQGMNSVELEIEKAKNIITNLLSEK